MMDDVVGTLALNTFEQVSAFTLDLRYDDIPANTRQYAKLLLLDTLGVAAAASQLDAGAIARRTAKDLYAASTTGPAARILFDGTKVSTAGAGFAGATQIDNLDAHDGYNPVKGHVGVAIVPALCALAEGRQISGQEALTGMIIGYEIACRAGLSLHDTVADYHTSGAWNALGVASVGTRLLGLSREQYRHALGIAEYHGPRSQMMREIDNPSMLHDGSGWGTMAGITAVHMAAFGFAGAPAITVESDAIAHHWRDLGSNWLLDQQYVKPYPICRWAHAPLDGVLQLRKDHNLTADDIMEVEVITFHEAARLNADMPATPSIAQYSLAFPLAAALVYGEVGITQITGDGLCDQDVENLLPRIKVHEGEFYNDRFPDGRWAEVTLALKDGGKLTSGPVNARGGPGDLLGGQEILEKFTRYASPILGHDKTQAIIDGVLQLDAPGHAFDELLDLVCMLN